MGITRTLIQFRFLYELQVHFTKAGNEGIVKLKKCPRGSILFQYSCWKTDVDRRRLLFVYILSKFWLHSNEVKVDICGIVNDVTVNAHQILYTEIVG
jgi:hypothetical protein